MLPNLSRLQTQMLAPGPSADGARVKLVVTESEYTQISPRLSSYKFRVHLATVSLAEIAVAEYCYSLLNSEREDDASTSKRQKLEEEPSPGYYDSDMKRLRRIVLLAHLVGKEVGDLINDLERQKLLKDSDGSRRSFNAWHRLTTITDVLRRKQSEERTAACRVFLADYLSTRNLPTDASPVGKLGLEMADSRFLRYEEYLNRCDKGFFHSSDFTKTLRVHGVGTAPSACVGVVMLDDELKQYVWSGFPTDEIKSEWQWRMEGVVACPFYLNSYGGGVGSTLLGHIKQRVDAAPDVSRVAVAVAHSAPPAWKAKLRDALFINCSECG